MKKRIAKVLLKLSLVVVIYAVYDLMYSAYITCSAFEFDWMNLIVPVTIVAVDEFAEEMYRAYLKRHASY